MVLIIDMIDWTVFACFGIQLCVRTTWTKKNSRLLYCCYFLYPPWFAVQRSHKIIIKKRIQLIQPTSQSMSVGAGAESRSDIRQWNSAGLRRGYWSPLTQVNTQLLLPLSAPFSGTRKKGCWLTYHYVAVAAEVFFFFFFAHIQRGLDTATEEGRQTPLLSSRGWDAERRLFLSLPCRQHRYKSEARFELLLARRLRIFFSCAVIFLGLGGEKRRSCAVNPGEPLSPVRLDERSLTALKQVIIYSFYPIFFPLNDLKNLFINFSPLNAHL